MKKSRIGLSFALLAAALLWSVPPTTTVQASSAGMPGMMWMTTSNWLNCDQTGSTPECADYRTPNGNLIYVTCCVPAGAIGSADLDACADGGFGRGRTEL